MRASLAKDRMTAQLKPGGSRGRPGTHGRAASVERDERDERCEARLGLVPAAAIGLVTSTECGQHDNTPTMTVSETMITFGLDRERG